MHTIEINGRPIAIMGGTHDEVQAYALDAAFQDDMSIYEDEHGQPLWDGIGDFSPVVRTAHPQEIAEHERVFAEALNSGEADAGDRDDFLVFLQRVVDSTGNTDETFQTLR